MSAATVAPSDFVAVGEDVAVITMDSRGPTRLQRAAVATVGAQHFTVEGIVTPGGNPRPIKFRNRPGGMAVGLGDVVHEATGDAGVYVVEDSTDVVTAIRRRIANRRVEVRMSRATEAWRRTNGNRAHHLADRRPSAVEVDGALLELIEAALAMRQMLGVPGEEN